LTGFELPAAPAAPAEATEQGLLFDEDCSQPDSADTFVQADALEVV